MNTEELEQSLRAEFESQMANELAKLRSDVAGLQENYQNELEKNRAQMDDAFRILAEKLDAPFEFDRAFSESVVEHLRLARDEGAKITATAMGEAEKLSDNNEPKPNLDAENLRIAVNEIKANSTQAAILRALVDAAANFAPRGVFFIVKNDHLVGWKAFGDESVDDNTVRGIHFPVNSETMVSDALNSNSNVQGSYADRVENSKFLGPLSFGAPDQMFAIPLCARGRGVAVLYADGGEAGEPVNIAALETLVSVAGLRVELLASATAAPVQETAAETQVEAVCEPEQETAEAGATEEADVPAAEELVAKEPEAEEEVVAESSEAEYAGEVEVATVEAESTPDEGSNERSRDFALSENNFSEAQEAAVEVDAIEELVHAEVEAPVEATAAKSYRERNVDLPIEVSDDERRPHSDARRFARLLVSEIRLYNEQKVVEGRESGDIYEILREAIDRSREMYEKRVQPDVSAKFDYFHYELVNNLAEGDEEKLGASYMAVKA